MGEQPVAVATVVASGPSGPAVGWRLRISATSVEGSLDPPSLQAAVVEEALRLLEAGASRTLGFLPSGGGWQVVRERRRVLTLGPQDLRIYIEVQAPPPRVAVFGAGHDAPPLVHLLRFCGFRPVVVDSRSKFAVPERFPEAEAVLCAPPEQAADVVGLDERSAAVVVTHNFQHDLRILRGLAGRRVRYVGLLGPAERRERLLSALAGEGVPVGELRARLYGPAGLDIGAEGPEPIAVAIVAELMAVYAGRGGGFLKDRQAPIHAEV